MHRSYRVGDSAFGVRTTSRAFGAWLEDVLDAYRVRRRAEVEYSIVIEGGRADTADSRRRFHILYQGVGAVSRTLSLQTLARGLFAELESRLLHLRDDAMFVHAGVVSIEGTTVLVPSWLIASLTGLGRRLARADAQLPAARWVGIDPSDGALIPIGTGLVLPVDALARLGGLGSAGHEDARFSIDRRLRVDAVLTPNPAFDTVDVGPRAEALHGVGALSANLGVLKEQGLEGLARLVQGARCYRVGVGPPHRMLEAMSAIARHERAHRSPAATAAG